MSKQNNGLYICDVCSKIAWTAQVFHLQNWEQELHACSKDCKDRVKQINNENWREILTHKPLVNFLEIELHRNKDSNAS